MCLLLSQIREWKGVRVPIKWREVHKRHHLVEIVLQSEFEADLRDK